MNALDKILEMHAIQEIPLFRNSERVGTQRRCQACYYVLRCDEVSCPTHRLALDAQAEQAFVLRELALSRRHEIP